MGGLAELVVKQARDVSCLCSFKEGVVKRFATASRNKEVRSSTLQLFGLRLYVWGFLWEKGVWGNE